MTTNESAPDPTAGERCPDCGLFCEEPDEPIQPGDYYTVDPTSSTRCPSCGLVPARGSEGAARVAAARRPATPDSAPVALLGSLSSNAEEVSNLGPRVTEDAHGVYGLSDVGVDVVAAGDEGLEAGAGRGHASRLVDITEDCQDFLTVRGITVPAHHVVGMELGFTCKNCGGHTSITAPCIPAKTYPGFPPATPPAADASEPNIVQRIVNAWDCCGTCAGGVLASYMRDREADAATKARAEGVRQFGEHVARHWFFANISDEGRQQIAKAATDYAARIARGDA